MSRRALIIGAQAVTVGLLVLVVYLTLLRPDDLGTLSGIEAPGGEPPRAQVQAADKRDRSGDRDRGYEGRKDEGSDRAGTKRTGGAGAGAAGGAGVSTGTPAITPLGRQYDDTVTALLARVGFAAPRGDSSVLGGGAIVSEGNSAASEGD